MTTEARGPFAGTNQESDGGAIRDGQLQILVNGRLVPGGVVLVNRGGQSKINSAAVVSGCPELIFDGGDIGFIDGEAL